MKAAWMSETVRDGPEPRQTIVESGHRRGTDSRKAGLLVGDVNPVTGSAIDIELVEAVAALSGERWKLEWGKWSGRRGGWFGNDAQDASATARIHGFPADIDDARIPRFGGDADDRRSE